MRRAVIRGRFLDEKTGCAVDAQSKLIEKVMQQPEEFKKYGGLHPAMIPELFLSDKV